MSSKRIGILTEFNYEDMELWYPFYRLKEEGHETFTIGPEKGKTYNSKHGYPCKAEFGIDEIKVRTLFELFIRERNTFTYGTEAYLTTKDAHCIVQNQFYFRFFSSS